MSLTVGSLFSGIGGFDKGLQDAGFIIKWQCEKDAWCRKILTKHWPEVPKYDDVQTLDAATVEPVDLLAGGFPCQDLSVAGKRAGLKAGTRSGLWLEFARLIRALRPKYVLVENVPGLLVNHALGRVLGDLADCGYDAEWQVLSAAQFGAPHLRKRVWIVAYRQGCPVEKYQMVFSEELYEQFGRVGRDKLSTNYWQTDQPGFVGVDARIPHRVDRLRGLGNAVVPQIVEWIGRRIMRHDQKTHST